MPEKHDARKRRFLIVEDEGFMAYVVSRILSDFHSCEVVRASDGLGAIELFEKDKLTIDCIVADFNMKPINGLQLLQQIRTGEAANIPRDQSFIMLTGNAQSQVVKAALLLDVNAYLIKPVTAAKLVASLERVLSSGLNLKNTKTYEAVDISLANAFNDAEDKRNRVPAPLSSQGTIEADGAPASKDRNRSPAPAASNEKDAGLPEADSEIKDVRHVRVEKLREDMVLAEDIVREDGSVLLRFGTVLTTRIIAKIQKLDSEIDIRIVLVGKSASPT